MPSMPSINMDVTMPTITSPVIGGNYHIPGNIYNRTRATTQKKNETKNTDTIVAPTAPLFNNEFIDKDQTTTKSIAKNENKLTAKDLSGLNSIGLLTGLYDLSGTDFTATGYTSSNSNIEEMLSKILNQLENLKQCNNLPESTDSHKAALLPSESASKNAKILRFVVNGYNVLDTCRTVFFSKKETDGTFLLTGDRKYQSNSTNREETFYLLFKADGNCGTKAGYLVQPQVIQDYTNEYSFLYQLANKGTLHADKTGNLVSLKILEPSWKMDLLLDIGE